jgi:4-hydroxybenzoate polyprenyltransferase
MSAAQHPTPLAQRLWLYQAERFPVLKHGAAIAAFALSGASLPFLFRDPFDALDPWPLIVAVAVSFLLFLQLRIADEHKDFEDDRRFRPERPVPRGLVRLGELRRVAFGAAPAQALLAWSLDPALLIPLALAWGWMALMTVEFFAPRTLKARPVLYLVSHMAVTPLIALFAVACGLSSGDPPAPVFAQALAAFLALAFANGLALEVARKSWAPQSEREGVETYSKLWGPGAAAATTCAAVTAALALVGFIAFLADLPIWFSAAAAAPAALGAGAAGAYGMRPTPRRAETLERSAGLWALASSLLLFLAAVMKALAS